MFYIFGKNNLLMSCKEGSWFKLFIRVTRLQVAFHSWRFSLSFSLSLSISLFLSLLVNMGLTTRSLLELINLAS